MKLSIIVPVYNEEQNLVGVFANLRKVVYPCDVEFVVVDDCSKDNSWAIIQSYAACDSFKVHRQPVNQGKGAALRKGFSLASGDVIAIHDADFEYDPQEIARLVLPIINNRADVVYGSRFHKQNYRVHRTFHYMGNRLLTFLSNIFSGIYLSDMETCYKVMRSDIIQNLHLECQRFGFEPEVTAAIAKLNIRLEEHPVSYNPRNYNEGKKINWKDGVAAIWFILKFNLKDLAPSSRTKLPDTYLWGQHAQKPLTIRTVLQAKARSGDCDKDDSKYKNDLQTI